MAALKTFFWLVWMSIGPAIALFGAVAAFNRADHVSTVNWVVLATTWAIMCAIRLDATTSKSLGVTKIGAFWLSSLMLFGIVVWDSAGPFPLWAFYGSIFVLWIPPILWLAWAIRSNSASSTQQLSPN